MKESVIGKAGIEKVVDPTKSALSRSGLDPIKVSVIIPAFNVESYVQSAIRSVLDQTFRDWELIVINDGSTDKTWDACRYFRDPRITIIDKPKQGVAEARNVGIRHCRGIYVAFLDADDLWLPEKLERQVAFLERDPTVGLVFCGSRLMDRDGVRWGYRQVSKINNINPADVYLLNPIKNGSVPMLRKQALDSIRFTAVFPDGTKKGACYFDPRLSGPEDIDCWLRLMLNTSWTIHGLSDCLVHYRINPDGLSLSLDQYHANWLRLHDKIRADHPALFRRYSRLAEAYEYRFEAQRAILAELGRVRVIQLLLRAVLIDPAILIRDGFVTFLTMAAALGYCFMPKVLMRSFCFAWREKPS